MQGFTLHTSLILLFCWAPSELMQKFLSSGGEKS